MDAKVQRTHVSSWFGIFAHQAVAHPWRCWVAFLVLTMIGFLPSLGSSPLIWQDEVQIVDYGRVMLEPNTDWAVTWMAHKQKPLKPICYVGCVAAELSYRTTGSALGTRFFCVCGGFLFGTAVLWLMLLQGSPPAISLLFSGWMVLDPGLVASYRGGRLDAWALAFVMLGAIGLQLWATKRKRAYLWLGTVALALSPYIWLRAAVAIPAALLPLVWTNTQEKYGNLQSMLKATALTAVFGLLLLPPAWEGLRSVQDMKDSPVAEFRSLSGVDVQSRVTHMFHDAWEGFSLDIPLLLLVAVALVRTLVNSQLQPLVKTSFMLIVLATLAVQFELTTGINSHAGIYALPLLASLAISAIHVMLSCGWKQPLTMGLAVLLILHTGYNVIGRTYRGWITRAERGATALKPVVDALPTNATRLLVDDFRLYFLLRQQHRKIFQLFTDVDANKREAPFAASQMPDLLTGGSKALWTPYAETLLPASEKLTLPMAHMLIRPQFKPHESGN